jgi:hypothetical protein
VFVKFLFRDERKRKVYTDVNSWFGTAFVIDFCAHIYGARPDLVLDCWTYNYGDLLYVNDALAYALVHTLVHTLKCKTFSFFFFEKKKHGECVKFAHENFFYLYK